MALADVVQEAQEPVNVIYAGRTVEELDEKLECLRQAVTQQLLGQGIKKTDMRYENYLNMRYRGTETAMMILRPARGNFKTAFLEQHLREFNFVFPDTRDILVDDVRVRGIGSSGSVESDAGKLAYEAKATAFFSVKQGLIERVVCRRLYLMIPHLLITYSGQNILPKSWEHLYPGISS